MEQGDPARKAGDGQTSYPHQDLGIESGAGTGGKHRELIRGSRSKGRLKTAAIVGYTNAGKSTLLNTLTGAGVQAEDKLLQPLIPQQE